MNPTSTAPQQNLSPAALRHVKKAETLLKKGLEEQNLASAIKFLRNAQHEYKAALKLKASVPQLENCIKKELYLKQLTRNQTLYLFNPKSQDLTHMEDLVEGINALESGDTQELLALDEMFKASEGHLRKGEYFVYAFVLKILGKKKEAATCYHKLGEIYKLEQHNEGISNCFKNAIRLNPALIYTSSMTLPDLAGSQQALIQIAFENQLKLINGVASHKIGPLCYICYAWGAAGKTEEWLTAAPSSVRSAQDWIKRTLLPHLDLAGVRALFDLREASEAYFLMDYMENIRTSPFVLLVCTPNLARKYNEWKTQEAARGVGKEITLCHGRYNDPKLLKTVLRLSLEGDPAKTNPLKIVETGLNFDFRQLESYHEQCLRLCAKLRLTAGSIEEETAPQHYIDTFKADRERILKQKEISEADLHSIQSWRQEKEGCRKRFWLPILKSKNQLIAPGHFLHAPRLNPSFIQRGSYLRAIDECFEASSTVVLISKKGIDCKAGKTELAKQYAYHNTQRYKRIIWLAADNPKILASQYKELINEMGTASEKDEISQVKNWLSRQQEWLLVFDGAQDQKSLAPYLPSSGPHILITSRSDDWDYSTIEAGLFSEQEALTYLCRATHQDRDPSASLLAHELEYVPSSLQKAADYISGNKVSIAAYLDTRDKLLDRHKKLIEAKGFNVPPRNPDFLGRELPLVALEETLLGNPHAAAVLTSEEGLRGIGKTQIALQYVYRNAREYSLIWWVQAQSRSSLQLSYAELAKKLGISLAEEEEGEEALVKKVIDYLSCEQNGPWLLIFDDAKNAQELEPFVPWGKGNIIVSSFCATWSKTAKVLPITRFTPEQSERLILKMTGSQGKECLGLLEYAGPLAGVLEGYPLAIALASSYISAGEISLQKYLELFKEQQKIWEEKAPYDYPLAVKTALALSLERVFIKEQEEKIKELPSLIRPLLWLASYLSSASFSRELIQKWIGQKADFKEAGKFDFNHAIEILNQYKLIEALPKGQTISIQPSVQTFIRAQLSEDEQKVMGEEVVGLLTEALSTNRVSEHALSLKIEDKKVQSLWDGARVGLELALQASRSRQKEKEAKEKEKEV